MGDGIRHLDLNDREQGLIRIAVSTPREGCPWGILEPLRGTAWAKLVRPVSGEALSHAVHGWATPLVREFGPHPHAVLRRYSIPCALSSGDQCIGATPKCRPGQDMPDCYEPPGVERALRQALLTALLNLWNGRHVLTIEGAEFSLL